MTTTTVIAVVVALITGIAIGRYLLGRFSGSQLAQARREAQNLLETARAETETLRQQHIEEPRAALERDRQALEDEIAENKRVYRRSRQKLDERNEKQNFRTKRLNEREETLEEGAKALRTLQENIEREQREAKELRRRIRTLLEDAEARAERATKYEERAADFEARAKERSDRLAQKEEQAQRLVEERLRKLEQVAGMSRQDVREALRKQLEEETKLESAAYLKDIRDEAKLKASREAKRVVLTTIQRMAASHAIENTVSVVNLDSDDMKGRIIGREGRNIRAFEAATGIEVIVDDTPEAVILSGFNPVRREVARIALTRLVQDGRIHPARIEEVVEKVQAEIEEEIVEIGERTAIDLSMQGLHPELIRLVGRMRYRTSYGQNLLAHSIETSEIAGLMAAELGLDVTRARRAGLLHDIGKVAGEDLESPHAIVGMELCQRYKEHPDICNAVGAHHDEIEMTTLIAPIVQAADAISGARPGARREALEAYIKRLQKLEDLARSFDGVERVYAIQAGREIRVLVNHSIVSDAHSEQLAIDISRKIEGEMQYPGQVKVTVIREVRAVSYAK
jgi:ribonuclease Y